MQIKNKRRYVYLLIGCIVLLVFAFGVFLIIKLTHFDTKIEDLADEIMSSDACTEENTTFTVSPIYVDNITSITPLGNLNPSGHTFPTGHMYFNIRQKNPGEFGSPTIEAKLYAPIDATIDNINVMTHTNANPPSTDYSINFRTCEDFTFYFIHATSLSDKILNEIDLEEGDCDTYSTGGRDYQNCWKEVDIDVEAGEVIGTVGSGIRSNFDFGVVDFRISPYTYANPARWEMREDMFYEVCSTDYYAGELKQVLESKLGDFDGNQRTIEPICGSLAQDVPGTAQGIWILSGTEEVISEDPHMALVHDNFDPGIGVFSIGTSVEDIGIKSGTYRFDPASSGSVNLDFNLVKPGNQTFCYEVGGSFHDQDNSFSILIQLVSENTLRIGPLYSPSCGVEPWSLNDYVEFER